MATITITDNLGLTTSMDLRDDSALGRSKLLGLVATAKELFTEFEAPVDQAELRNFALGATAGSPDLLGKNMPKLTLGSGVNCELTIKTSADKTLCGSSQFSPAIPIGANEVWVGVEVDLSFSANASATVSSFGLTFAAASKFSCSTYTLSSGASLPLLRDACSRAFGNFSLTTGADAIRQQPVGTLNQTEVSGSLKTTAKLKLPYTINALGSANLPFNMTASVAPSVTVQVSGSIQIAGDFIFRSHTKAAGVVEIGVYKKRGSTLSASFTAGGSVGGELGGTDVLTMLLNAAMPGVDVTAAGITGDRGTALNGVIKDGLDESLGVQLNATCSAALTDEAAVVYEVRLAEGDQAATDSALELALGGDWSAIDLLPNAQKLRNVTKETMEEKWSMTLNLFGVYSATSVTDYVSSCTILLDETGQMSIIDKAEMSRISAQTSARASDTQKLRQALTEDFLSTATYAVVGGKLGLKLTVVQSYLDYQREMSAEEMRQNIQLGYELQLIPAQSLDPALMESPSFSHAAVSATVKYDSAALMNIFFKDPATMTAWTQEELEAKGRGTMSDFLDPADPTDKARMGILDNVQAWAAMDNVGSTSGIEELPYFDGFSAPQLHAVEGDWVSIRWWAGAVSKVGPALKATLGAVAAVPAGRDASKDAYFMKQRAVLAHVLGDVTRNTDAAFVHGWGEAVMFGLSGRAGTAVMDLAWNSNRYHYGGG